MHNLINHKQSSKTKPVRVSRTEIAKHVATSASLTQAKARSLIDTLIATIASFLDEGKAVELRGFANFATKSVPARQARNPRTGGVVEVRARRKVVIKASKLLLGSKAAKAKA